MSFGVFTASGSVSASITHPGIPYDVVAAYALLGPGLGEGSIFSYQKNAQLVEAAFRIDSVIANGGVFVTPLPAALPLFASGLGLMGWLARRKVRNDDFLKCPRGY
jgi:hypothetical protein